MNRAGTESSSGATAATLIICGLILAVWVAAAPSALAHYGDHTVGVTKDSDAPGGYGTHFKIEVQQTGIDNFNINSFVRGRASLRNWNNQPWIETGWQDYGCDNCGGSTPIVVYTLKYGSTQNTYPSYSLTVGSSYFFKVSEADTHVDSSAYIFYNGVWQLLTSTVDSPQCPCFERAGTWIYLYPIGDSSRHPALSGGIDFAQGKIKQSDNQWYQWNPSNFPQSSFFYTTPYVHCYETAYYTFLVKKDVC
jgi:hypothetical protein